MKPLHYNSNNIKFTRHIHKSIFAPYCYQTQQSARSLQIQFRQIHSVSPKSPHLSTLLGSTAVAYRPGNVTNRHGGYDVILLLCVTSATRGSVCLHVQRTPGFWLKVGESEPQDFPIAQANSYMLSGISSLLYSWISALMGM